MVDSRQPDARLWPLHISELESWQAEDRWLSDVFAGDDVSQGSFDLQKTGLNNSVFKLNYFWMKLKNAPFVAVMAMNAAEHEAKFSVPAKANTTEGLLNKNLIFHRLDLKVNL